MPARYRVCNINLDLYVFIMYNEIIKKQEVQYEKRPQKGY